MGAGDGIKRTWPDKATPSPRFSEFVRTTLESRETRRKRASSPPIRSYRSSRHPTYRTYDEMSDPRRAETALVSRRQFSTPGRGSVP